MKPQYVVKRLSDLHRAMIPLLAAGMGPTAVAAALKTTKMKVLRARENPEFQSELESCRREYTAGLTQALATELARDGMASVRLLQTVRDGKARGPADRLRVRVQAATVLLDRQLPKKLDVTQDRTIRLVIPAEKRRELEALMAEATDVELVGKPAVPGRP